MTIKQRKLLAALADGLEMIEAAKLAGYNLDYARRKAREPAFADALSRMIQAKRAGAPATATLPAMGSAQRDPAEVLWAVIQDTTTEDSQRIAAIRALLSYERAHPPEAEPHDVTIIDDIPPCADCPLRRKEGSTDDLQV